MNNVKKTALFDKAAIARNFSRAASSYDNAAVLQRQVGDALFSRLDLVKLEPKVILDLGSGTGYFSKLLEKHYRHSQIIAMDLAPGMLQLAKKRKTWRRRQHLACADVEQLPLADKSVDLIFANLCLQWCNDLQQTFKEWQRVLKPDGLLMFTSLGVDSLKELRQSWAQIDAAQHVHDFIDMHDVGDALMQAKFITPVMDMEYYTLTYQSILQLMKDIKAIGANNLSGQRRQTLTGKSQLKQLEQAYEPFREPDGLLPLTYEVVYGHAWGAPLQAHATADKDGLVSIPISQIKRS